jgi:hypothetical protein
MRGKTKGFSPNVLRDVRLKPKTLILLDPLAEANGNERKEKSFLNSFSWAMACNLT